MKSYKHFLHVFETRVSMLIQELKFCIPRMVTEFQFQCKSKEIGEASLKMESVSNCFLNHTILKIGKTIEA